MLISSTNGKSPTVAGLLRSVDEAQILIRQGQEHWSLEPLLEEEYRIDVAVTDGHPWQRSERSCSKFLADVSALKKDGLIYLSESDDSGCQSIKLTGAGERLGKDLVESLPSWAVRYLEKATVDPSREYDR